MGFIGFSVSLQREMVNELSNVLGILRLVKCNEPLSDVSVLSHSESFLRLRFLIREHVLNSLGAFWKEGFENILL